MTSDTTNPAKNATEPCQNEKGGCMIPDDDAVIISIFALACLTICAFGLLVGFYALAVFSFFGWFALYVLEELVNQKATWGFACDKLSEEE